MTKVFTENTLNRAANTSSRWTHKHSVIVMAYVADDPNAAANAKKAAEALIKQARL